MKLKEDKRHLRMVNNRKCDGLTPEQAEFFERYNGSISRENTNKILKLANTGFSISPEGFLEYNRAYLDVGAKLEDKVWELYERVFKGRVGVQPINLIDEENELDPGMHLALHLEFPITEQPDGWLVQGTKSAVVDVYLHDLQYSSAFTSLLGIAYFFRNQQQIYSEYMQPCYSLIDITEQAKKLEEELFTDDYMEYLHFQLFHANTVVEFSCGETLEENGMNNGNGVAHLFFSNSPYLFRDLALTMQDPEIDYHVVPKDFSYDVLFQNETVDIGPYLPLFRFEDTDEIPTQICIPDLKHISDTSNLQRIEIYIKHLVFLAKLKKLRKVAIGDWGDTLFNYINIPHFEVPATLIMANKSEKGEVEYKNA